MGNGMAELATTFAVRETGGIRCVVEETRGFGGMGRGGGAVEVTDFFY